MGKVPQSSSSLGVIMLCLTLAALLIFDWIAAWHFIAISLRLSLCSGIAVPAEKALLPRLTRPEFLANRLAINTIAYELTRSVAQPPRGLSSALGRQLDPCHCRRWPHTHLDLLLSTAARFESARSRRNQSLRSGRRVLPMSLGGAICNVGCLLVVSGGILASVHRYQP